jgi:circadian clock protein KaiC
MITIKCPSCQTENLHDAEFCRHCSTRLAKECVHCGTTNPYQFIYCAQCGQNLSPAAEPVSVAGEKQDEEKKEVAEEIAAADETEVVLKDVKAKVEAEAKIILEELIGTQTVQTAEEAEEEQKDELRFMDILMPARVSTGIEGLDRLIDGGFMAGKTYLVSGEPGTGKTVFGMQFLNHGLMNGENGIYASAIDKPTHIIVDAHALGWHFKPYIQDRRLGFLDISSHFAQMRLGNTNGIDVEAIITEITNRVKAYRAKRLVIDAIAPFMFSQESFQNVQEYIQNLLLTIKDNLGCTVLITSSIPSGSAFLSRYGSEEFLVEGIIVLAMSKFESHIIRTINVIKMRSTAADLSEHAFEIVTKKGIVLKD